MRIWLEPEFAWAALERFDEWLVQLSTIKDVEHQGGEPFLKLGRKYLVHTPEGVTMRALVTRVDRKLGEVRIEAKGGPLRSSLTCRIENPEPGVTVLVRIQEYPGWVGKVFTWIKGRREAAETSEYLERWAAFALGLEAEGEE
ncbi:hypothetical protein BSR28_06980 [Boudabousia liubingyangii]|nr:hypothetical protein BSR28_06980 [Boudabousia liubingyangii]